jgi:hypothetical protein
VGRAVKLTRASSFCLWCCQGSIRSSWTVDLFRTSSFLLLPSVDASSLLNELSSSYPRAQLRHLPSRAPPPQQQQRPSTGSPQPFDLTSLQQSIQHNHQPGPPPEWARDFGAFHAAPGPSSVQQQAPQDWQRGMEAGWGRASPAGPNSIQHHPQHQQQPDFSAWDSAFVNQQSQPSALHHQHPHPSQSIYQQQPLYQPSFQPTHFATSRPFLPPAQQLQQQPELTVLDKGKGKEETSWDHHFATYENLQAEGPQKEKQKEEDKEGEEKEKTGEDWTDAQKEVDKLEAYVLALLRLYRLGLSPDRSVRLLGDKHLERAPERHRRRPQDGRRPRLVGSRVLPVRKRLGRIRL